MKKPISILLIEDSPTDASILEAAFSEFEETIVIQVATDSVQATERLEQAITANQMPHIILIDLNLPGKSGHEVLRGIKETAHWKQTPAIVLSSSALPADILKSYELSANAYITKPGTLEGYARIAERIRGFWLKTAQLPANQPAIS